MGLITWIEDLPRYVQPMIDNFSDLGHEVRVVKDCSSLLKRLDAIVTDSDVLILDLWLPVGTGEEVPRRLAPQAKNSERGRWLYKQVLTALAKQDANARIVVLSGNLDVDTQQKLKDELGLEDRYLWKKPAEFDAFTKLIDRLASRVRAG